MLWQQAELVIVMIADLPAFLFYSPHKLQICFKLTPNTYGILFAEQRAMYLEGKYK